VLLLAAFYFDKIQTIDRCGVVLFGVYIQYDVLGLTTFLRILVLIASRPTVAYFKIPEQVVLSSRALLNYNKVEQYGVYVDVL